MWTIKKSRLFKSQLLLFSKDYKERANIDVANKFIDSVEDSIDFIKKTPLACSIYLDAKEHPLLKQYEFRKWRVKGFQHYVFFRISNNQEIFLDAIYAYKMDTMIRFGFDFKHSN